MKTYATAVEGSLKPLRKEREQKRDTENPDWRFTLLAEFEDLVRSYGQDHVSLR